MKNRHAARKARRKVSAAGIWDYPKRGGSALSPACFMTFITHFCLELTTKNRIPHDIQLQILLEFFMSHNVNSPRCFVQVSLRRNRHDDASIEPMPRSPNRVMHVSLLHAERQQSHGRV